MATKIFSCSESLPGIQTSSASQNVMYAPLACPNAEITRRAHPRITVVSVLNIEYFLREVVRVFTRYARTVVLEPSSTRINSKFVKS